MDNSVDRLMVTSLLMVDQHLAGLFISKHAFEERRLADNLFEEDIARTCEPKYPLPVVKQMNVKGRSQMAAEMRRY